jgi:hypothetical protein
VSEERQARLPALLILALGVGMMGAAIALAVRAYMPCPFWDEWAVVNAIAKGAGVTSWGWLWSEHNEHRLLATRLLILLDLRVFGGKNVSLFVEMFAAQLVQLGAIWHVLARYTDLPRTLKLSIAGVFAFCLFHLNQAENFTWAFQASFVIAFAIGTLALIGVAYFERWRWPMLVSVAVGIAPLAAGLNVAGGLMIGPVVLVYALRRRLGTRYVVVIAAIFVASVAAYLTNYHVPASHLTPMQALAHPREIFVYVLTYFGASWTRLMPHKERITCLLSFVALAVMVVKSAKRRAETTAFEWFCIAECVLMIVVSITTALGRLQYGVGQAFAGRYQTPAMLYWAALCALVLVQIGRYWPERLRVLEWGVALILIASAGTCLPIWRAEAARNDALARACDAAMHRNEDERAAKLLYGGTTRDLEPGVDYLKKVWRE